MPHLQMVTLEQALACHRQGRLDEADALYRQLLEREPAQVDALRLRSILAEQRGDLSEAIQLAQKALALKSNQAALHLALASPLLGQNRVDEALTAIQHALRIDRRNVDAYLLLGDAHQQQQAYPAAIEAYQRALKQDRSVAEAYNNMANAYAAMRDFSTAIGHYLKAISLRATYVEAHFNLGNAYRLTRAFPQAMAAYQQALALNPGFYQALAMSGLTCKEQGRFAEAERFYQQAMAASPPQAAMQASLWYNLGNVHQAQKQFHQAEQAYLQAISADAGQLSAWLNLGTAFAEQGKTAQAGEVYATLVQDEPENPVYQLNQALNLPVIYQNTAEIEQTRAHYTARLDALLMMPLRPLNTQALHGLAATGFYLAYQNQNDRALQAKLGQVMRKLLPGASTTLTARAPHMKPRIGLISRHLSPQHTIGKLTQGMIRGLSRDAFDVSVFSVGEEHPYLPTAEEQAQMRFHRLPGHNLDEAAQRIRSENLDLLLFTDIGMDPLTYLLAFYRLAPVQCATWGHPVTSGVDTIDYFVSSRWIEPEAAQDHYTEQLVLLDRLPAYYERPLTPEAPLDLAAFGFSADAHLYLCPQSLFKLHPDFDALLQGILQRDPQGIIVLVSHPAPEVNDLLMARFGQRLPEEADRIRFVPRLNRAEFLNLMRCAHVLLDPPGFGGGNTTYEALALGVPVVTWPGAFMRGCVTLGCYRQMGLQQAPVAGDAAEYVTLAVRIATQPEVRQQYRDAIMQAHPALFEDGAFLVQLEQFFREALAAKGVLHAG